MIDLQDASQSLRKSLVEIIIIKSNPYFLGLPFGPSPPFIYTDSSMHRSESWIECQGFRLFGPNPPVGLGAVACRLTAVRPPRHPPHCPPNLAPPLHPQRRSGLHKQGSQAFGSIYLVARASEQGISAEIGICTTLMETTLLSN